MMAEHDCTKCGTGYLTSEEVPLPFVCTKCRRGDLPPVPPDPLAEITKVLDMQAETMKNLMEVVAQLNVIVEKIAHPIYRAHP